MSEISNLSQNIKVKKIDKETINVQVLNNNMLMAIVGQFNQNLIHLEKLTKSTIFFRGNSITIKGNTESTIKASEAIKFLPKLNSELMKIAKTGIIKKQNASRNISRITKKIATL